jgi:hypothetical protein
VVGICLRDRGLAAERTEWDSLERELGVFGELLEHRSVVTGADSFVEPLDVRPKKLFAKRLPPSPIPARRSPTARRC